MTESDSRKSLIIQAAAETFMHQGYAATSIDDVARSLGCTKGMIYYHFKTKSDLFFSIHRQIIEFNLSEARPLASSSKSAFERLKAMALSRLNSIIDHLPYQRVSVLGLEMISMSNTTPKDRLILNELIELYDEYENLFVKVISDGMKEGVFAKGNPRMAVKPLLGSINWMIMWYRPRSNMKATDRDDLCGMMTDFILRGLSNNTDI
ncbi:MAG: TetR/AcrR family transcriptional regulator [Novosphingobium sp.]